MLTCVLSLLTSGGRRNVSSFSVLRSSFAIAPWYIMPNQRFWLRSKRTESAPVGKPGFSSGIGNSVTAPVRGSSLPSVCSPKFEYQAMPSGSTMTSCGSMVGRGRSYSVMTTRVPRPTGRGSVFNAYSQRGAELRLIEARNSACSRRKRSRSSPRISSWRSASRSWGWSGVLWFAYFPMRGSTCWTKPAASCEERMMRSSVWQPTQFRSESFCCGVPAALSIHSAFVSWAARSLAGRSSRSALAAG